MLLAWPLASTPYCPGCKFGTVKARLKLPPSFTVGEPTDWPLNVTSTVSPGLNPKPVAVIEAPGRPDDEERVRWGSGTVVAWVVGLGTSVAVGLGSAWPSTGAGTISNAIST